jgi:hypothetical protein
LAHWGLLGHGQKIPSVGCPENKDTKAIKIFKAFIKKSSEKP